MKTQLEKTAQELGFKPQYQPMTREQTELFATVLLSGDMEEISDKEAPHPLKILRKRIEVLELPIKFSPKAELLSLIVTDGNPGKMMTVLIEALSNYENKTVDADEIAELYPWGFYTEDSVMELIDNYFKTRKAKWSEIY